VSTRTRTIFASAMPPSLCFFGFLMVYIGARLRKRIVGIDRCLCDPPGLALTGGAGVA
jgi:hypothetical protein